MGSLAASSVLSVVCHMMSAGNIKTLSPPLKPNARSNPKDSTRNRPLSKKSRTRSRKTPKLFFYFFISTPFITEIGKLVVVFRQNDGVSSFCLMVSVSMERILRLGNIESPRSKAPVSSFVFGGSTISLNLYASNSTIMGLRVVRRNIIGHSIRIGVGHSQGRGQARQDNSDKCQVFHDVTE